MVAFLPLRMEVSFYRDCAVPYLRHFHTGYSIFHCDLMEYDLMPCFVSSVFFVQVVKLTKQFRSVRVVFLKSSTHLDYCKHVASISCANRAE